MPVVNSGARDPLQQRQQLAIMHHRRLRVTIGNGPQSGCVIARRFGKHLRLGDQRISTATIAARQGLKAILIERHGFAGAGR